MSQRMPRFLCSVTFAALTVLPACAAPQTFHPGAPWLDDRGQHIQAHGGAVVRVGDAWYWFGEDRSRDNDRSLRYVACYSSKDLAHWTFRNQALKLADPEEIGRSWVLERPKVFPIAKTGKFVMYFHLDGPAPGRRRGYDRAEVGVAVSDTIDGDYHFLRAFRPLGKESRDIGQFIDDDGAGYLIFECRPTGGFYIAKLSADGLAVEKEVAFIKAPLEGGAVVHYDGLYYVLGSHLTGWNPNPNQYATAPRLEGPWSEFKDVAPLDKRTYDSQSSNLIKVVGSKKTTVIYYGDQWKPQTQWDSRYLWMPVEIGGGRLSLPEPREWTLDVATGETSVTK
jgi:hypothetical protein